MPSITSLIALLSLTASLIQARPMRRDVRLDEEDSFALERMQPGFSCQYTTDETTGARHFWCPSPCRLRDDVKRSFGEEIKPAHWQCPPTIATKDVPRNSLCHWKRSGKLACNPACGWLKTQDGFSWSCTTPALLSTQSPSERESLHLGWASGPIDAAEVWVRSGYLCGREETACPLHSGVDIGSTLVPRGSYECVATRESLENCGGCSAIGMGRDCSNIPHSSSACSAGRCVILSCKSGYQVSSDGEECIRSPTTAL